MGWSGFWIAVAMLAIAFSGEPDIVDAVVHNLTGVWPEQHSD